MPDPSDTHRADCDIDSYDLAMRPLPESWDRVPKGRVLCFAPHPDDEVIGPGGALHMHCEQGDPVRVVIATDGVAGDPDGRHQGQDYAALRREESVEGLRRLGVSEVEFWGYPDSYVVSAADLELLVARAVNEITSLEPEVVYLPWEGEVNSDHRALYAAVVGALDRVSFSGTALGYEVWTAMHPEVLLDISRVEAVKRHAIAAYESQLDYVDYAHVIFGLHAHHSLLFGSGKGFWEAYRRVR